MKDLKERAVRGSLARVCAQAANLSLRVGSLIILTRILEPRDFGLVGMVTALTGVLYLFRDFGLSAATVQRASVTEEQTSTLFWINIVAGGTLTLLVSGLAPVFVAFYHEPRLLWVTVVLASGFFFNAAGIQHSALLQRQMRFTSLSMIDTGSWILSTGVAVCAARAGWGYWALVAMTVTQPLVTSTCAWFASGWVPGMPRRRSGIRSLLRFGSTLTINGLIVYVASNFEKVLLGRFWGADAIGIYGRAFQLIKLPTDTLNGAIGEVAFSALSRLQDDPSRLRSYFLKGYSLVLALTLPATVACGLFATDMIIVVLGPKWKEAAPIFRLLTPTILVFAIANPLGWFLGAIGMVGRGVKMALVIAPLMIASYFVGLPYGPKGVAFAYSVVMVLWTVPVIVWSVYGTVISPRDVFVAVSRPLASSAVGAAVAFTGCLLCGPSHWVRLALGSALLIVTYLVTLFYVMGQRAFYMDLIQRFTRRLPVDDEVLVSA